MTTTYNLGPAADQLNTLVKGVEDDQLDSATPCAEYTVRDLLGHIIGLTAAFANAARKQGSTDAPPGSPGDLVTGDWRARIETQLTDLAQAWRDPAAWDGMTSPGGVEVPAELAGKIALNELVLHGWDLAVATGQPFSCDEASARGSLEFTSLVNSPEWGAGREGLFTEVVEVPEDASPLHRTLGLSGRDPGWRLTLP
jgi:uncharacterized protein (TIGR03086 family)